MYFTKQREGSWLTRGISQSYITRRPHWCRGSHVPMTPRVQWFLLPHHLWLNHFILWKLTIERVSLPAPCRRNPSLQHQAPCLGVMDWQPHWGCSVSASLFLGIRHNGLTVFPIGMVLLSVLFCFLRIVTQWKQGCWSDEKSGKLFGNNIQMFP